MRGVGVWGWGVALVVGLAAAAGASAQDAPVGAPPARSGSWFSRLLFKPDRKLVNQDKETAARTAAANKGPTVVEAAAVQRAREEAALLRRLEVCDKLRAIAEQTNDDDLLRRADRLSQQAEAVYHQRTAHLPGAGGTAEDAERILERHLGSGAADGRALTDSTRAGRGALGGRAAGRDVP